RANFPRIRLFLVAQKAMPMPESDVATEEGGWRAVTSESVGSFSAVAYLFGRELHQRYQVPIGLIESAWAGTFIEAWMSEAALKPFTEFREGLDRLVRASPSPRDKAAYAAYLKQKASWYQEHGMDDRGRHAGRDIWAEPTFDAAGW